jgi:hypothetical protein
MLMFEMLSISQPFAGLNEGNVITHVLQLEKTPDLLAIEPRIPGELVTLLNDCWSRDPSARPPIEALQKRLMAMKTEPEFGPFLSRKPSQVCFVCFFSAFNCNRIVGHLQRRPSLQCIVHQFVF